MCDDLHVVAPALDGGAQHEAADAPEPVDGDLHRHGCCPFPSLVGMIASDARRFRTAAATASGVMPKWRNRSSAGAEAPKPVMPMNRPPSPSQRAPAERRRGLDADAERAVAQHLRAVALVLLRRTAPSRAGTRRRRGCPRLPAWRARRARPAPRSRWRSGWRGAGRRRPRPDVAAAGAAVLRPASVRKAGRFWRDRASMRGPSRARHRQLPALRRFHRVGRAEHVQVRHRPEGGEVLDRLVGRPVLAQADAVMRQHVDHPLPHERGEADRRAACSRRRRGRCRNRG